MEKSLLKTSDISLLLPSDLPTSLVQVLVSQARRGNRRPFRLRLGRARDGGEDPDGVRGPIHAKSGAASAGGILQAVGNSSLSILLILKERIIESFFYYV